MIENPLTLHNGTNTPKLKQVATRQSLYNAWRKVRANRGAAGIDAVSLKEFERNLEANLAELSRNLLNKSYEPLPVRQVNIPKRNGKERELMIPTVRDRIAQRSVLDAIEPLFDPAFLDSSFAFRPGRSVAMAIQRVVIARAKGYLWTVDADIKDFFPSIDHKLLLDILSETIRDEDLLSLISKWLDAGLLESEQSPAGWMNDLRATLAGAQLVVGDGINHLLNEYVSGNLGVTADHSLYDEEEPGFDEESLPSSRPALQEASRRQARRAAMRRLVQDGALLAIAERATLRSLLGAKVLGVGGAALALAALTPAAVRAAKRLMERKTGATQGSPISPLLSNIYLHAFDEALMNQGLKLTRYCDDFVIACRSEAEAREALGEVESRLKVRRLSLNRDKTRLVAPGEEFTFLGYLFAANGRVIAPPTTTDALAKEVMKLAERSMKRASSEIAATPGKTWSLVSKLKTAVRKS
jgi:retron-type reverse transcriptase